MRSFNEGWVLRETLESLMSQTLRDWRLFVIDSGSTDGSMEIFRDFPVTRLVQIKPQEYIPGRVLNRGMEMTESDFVVFLNADATPANDRWLENLVSGATDAGNVAACFGRQIPRKDCKAPFKRDYEVCFGPQRKSASWDHFFSMVNSLVFRDMWKMRPFREDIQYAEDHEFSLYWKKSGKEIRYIDESCVIHSHNYSPKQSYIRAREDSFAIVKATGDQAYAGTVSKAVTGCVNDIMKDLIFCCACRCPLDWIESVPVRVAQRLGKWQGAVRFRETMDHHSNP